MSRFLALAALFSLVACGSGSASEDDSTAGALTNGEEETSEPTVVKASCEASTTTAAGKEVKGFIEGTFNLADDGSITPLVKSGSRTAEPIYVKIGSATKADNDYRLEVKSGKVADKSSYKGEIVLKNTPVSGEARGLFERLQAAVTGFDVTLSFDGAAKKLKIASTPLNATYDCTCKFSSVEGAAPSAGE